MLQKKVTEKNGSWPRLETPSDLLAFLAFEGEGRLSWANSSFCQTPYRTPSGIKDQHHNVLVDAEHNSIRDDKTLRGPLGRDDSDAQDCRRIATGGREIPIRAPDDPAERAGGRLVNIVRPAADLTRSQLVHAETAAKPDAMARARATIGFAPGGDLLDANQNVLAAPRGGRAQSQS